MRPGSGQCGWKDYVTELQNQQECGLRVGEVCGIKSPTGDLDRNRWLGTASNIWERSVIWQSGACGRSRAQAHSWTESRSTLLPAAGLPTADSASRSQYPFPPFWEVPTNRVERTRKWNTLAVAGWGGVHQETLRPLWTFADLHLAPWSSEELWEVDGAGICITPTSQKGKLGSRVTGLIKDRSGRKLRSISNASFFSFMGTGDRNKEDYWINNFYRGKIYIT